MSAEALAFAGVLAAACLVLAARGVVAAVGLARLAAAHLRRDR